MTCPRYIAVDWRHKHADEPVRLFSEVDTRGWEIRKVEEFRDGRKLFADASAHSGSARLGEVPIPAISEIAKDPQFAAREISREEFERVWLEANAT